MIKIRLVKLGAKGNPSYRVVVISSQRKRAGKPVDFIGYWYPSKEINKINTEKLKYWMDKGAQTSNRIRKLVNK